MSLKLSSYIDHTLLKPDASIASFDQLCKEALEFQFFGVCVNSSYVSYCAKQIRNADSSFFPKIVSVVGFPLGAMSIAAKAFEVASAVKDGAEEIDTVIAIGRLKDKDFAYVKNDLSETLKACAGKPLKVIIETSLLTEADKIAACEISAEVGVQFVKTSTGFGGGGATVEDVRLMKKIVGPNIQVKASGGIRDIATAEAMIAAGATRLGTSSGVALVQGHKIQGGY